MSEIERAITLACDAHSGQVDKAGQPYIFHPLRVMLKLTGEEERLVGILHDVIEDSNYSLNDLRQLGFSEVVVDAIECLTKKNGEPYGDFITRLSSNELARAVKIEDIRDNLDISRLIFLSEEDLARIKKYHKALQYLLTNRGKSGTDHD